MHGTGTRDGDRPIDWGLASRDYARFRPGYPDSFFARVTALGIGTRGQRLLDLGTGTGVLARRFAELGCEVAGVDVAAGQIEAARQLASGQGLAIDFRVAPAEETGMPDGAFDVATASQCFHYFAYDRVLPELARVLAPRGLIMTSHISWLPREDAVARASEALVLRHNPDWSAGDWAGRVPEVPAWVDERSEVVSRFVYDEALPFTRETWRGRIRASRGIGAELTADEVAAFDAEHAAHLERTVPDSFTILHRIDAHVVRLRG